MPDWACAAEARVRHTAGTKARTMDRSFIDVPFCEEFWRTDEHIEPGGQCQQEISIAERFRRWKPGMRPRPGLWISGRDAEFLEAEDQAGAEANQFGRGDCDVSALPDGGAADGGQGAVADLQDAEVHMARQGVIDAAVDAVIDLLDVDSTCRGLSAALADGGLDVGLERAREWAAGDAHAHLEVLQHRIVGVLIGEAQVEAGVELTRMIEIVETAQVVSPENLERGVLAEEGEGAGV